MKESSKQNKFTRESIIGLGEDSFRKNYYPEMQGKILELEQRLIKNRSIINLIPDIIITCDAQGHLTPYLTSDTDKQDLTMSLMRDRTLSMELKEMALSAQASGKMSTYLFDHLMNDAKRSMEARIIPSDEDVLIIVRDISGFHVK